MPRLAGVLLGPQFASGRLLCYLLHPSDGPQCVTMRVCCDDTGEGIVWCMRRNVSISPAGLVGCFLGLSGIACGIGIVFAWFGVWWVLPFAGLETLFLMCAFSYVAIHASDFEEVWVTEDRVRVVARNAWGTHAKDFERWRVRLIWSGEVGQSELWLSCHDAEVEIGRLLNGFQRQQLAQLLTRQLKI